jgi:hypothetical protein
MQKFQLLPLLLCGFLVCSCSQQPDNKAPRATDDQAPEQQLSAEIAETSGLACLRNNQFLTINDSGNAATVYQLDASGRIINRYATNGRNQDWEALALHQGRLWIADIGNNSGQRATLDLYNAPIPQGQIKELMVDRLELRYPQAPMTKPSFYQHELDAEALVSTGDSLLIFSKNWIGLQSRVYAVDTNAKASTLAQVGVTSALPGVITDVAYSAQQQVFVVAGYENFRLNPLTFMLSGDFAPFIAVLDAKYQLITSVQIPTGGQLEAVCLDDTQNIWLSQESSSHHKAKMWRWGALSTLLSATD